VIFTSLPRSGTIRAARLPAEIGDARGRFPARDFLTCLAGVAPTTRQSGKVKSVTFRRGAGKQLRDALCDFAGDSRSASPWAADLYDKAIARGCATPTPCASSPGPGHTSSGDAGRTTPPTTLPPTTAAR
jgi:transposase